MTSAGHSARDDPGQYEHEHERTTRTLERLLAIDATTLEAALTEAARLVAEALDADTVDALLYDAAADTWIAQGVSSTPLGPRERALRLDRWPRTEDERTTAVSRSGTPFVTGHAERDVGVPRALTETLGVRSLLEVPLEIGEDRRGVLAVAALRPEAFSAQDVAFLQAVARWMGLVAHRAEQAERAVRAEAQAAREQAAREQVERVLESIDDAFYALDHAGRFIYINQRAEALWGKQRDDLLGRDLLAVFPHVRGSANYAAIRRALTERATVPFEDRSPVLGIWIAGRAYPTPDGVAVYFQDVSERKRLEEERAELALWEREARQVAQASAARLEAVQAVTDAALRQRGVEEVLRTVLERITQALRADNAAILLLEADDEHLVVYLARGPEEAVTGRMRVPVGQGVAGRIAANRRPLIVDDLRTLEPVNPVLREQMAALLGVPLLVGERLLGVLHVDSATPRHFTDEELHLVQLIADRVALVLENARLLMAEQEARRQAEAAVRLRDGVLTVTTHDLRAPLTSLLGRVGLVEQRLAQGRAADGPWLGQQMQAMRRAARRMEAMLEELADVAHLQMGQALSLQMEEVDLVPLARQVADEAAPTGGSARITLTAPATLRVCGDRNRLQRVLQNIVGNAVKYSPSDRPITVTLADEAPWAVVVVRDRGVGIPAGELPRIASPFYRASTARGVAGTGIGLWGARAIVTQHGGDLRIASTEGEGTTVTVRLRART